MAKKVMILPCSGIGKPAGEIGRQAAYQATRLLRPELLQMACLARLVIDDPETIAMLHDNYVITLDGCPEDCARKNVERFNKRVDYAFHVADLMDQYPDLHPLGILNLGDGGNKLTELMSIQVAAKVDELTAKEGQYGDEYKCE